MKARDHYDNHLAFFYSWMVGDFQDKLQEQKKYFNERKIKPSSSNLAFDLGSGHGLQSVALAEIGFEVKAVDFNRQLLDELQIHQGSLNIERIHTEILLFLKGTSQKAELIVCMGDTLTHLESFNEVRELVAQVSKHLERNGKIIFSFRDFTTALKDEDRFIFVKGDDSRILTCFLEYFSDYVMVHDILYEKKNGAWVPRISAYPKLRLGEGFLNDLLRQNGIITQRSEIIKGMVHIVGEMD